MFDGKHDKPEPSLDIPELIEVSQILPKDSISQINHPIENSQALPLSKMPSIDEQKRQQRLQIIENNGSPGAFKMRHYERENSSDFRHPKQLRNNDSFISGRKMGSDRMSETSEYIRQQAQREFIKLFDREQQKLDERKHDLNNFAKSFANNPELRQNFLDHLLSGGGEGQSTTRNNNVEFETLSSHSNTYSKLLGKRSFNQTKPGNYSRGSHNGGSNIGMEPIIPKVSNEPLSDLKPQKGRKP